MADINKSMFSADRRGTQGKGDLHSGSMTKYRDSEFFGRSDCCDSQVMRLNRRSYCEKCGEPCRKTKEKS